ncbi:MAG: hypothetical protein RLZZ210_322 [Pseudomonadota bacterium]|jgi:putative transcriptional regulator
MAVQTTQLQTLTHYLLLSLSDDEEGAFHQSVVYVCDHNEDGALGLIINKEIDLKMSDLFRKLELDTLADNMPYISKKHVGIGGPSESERGFVLHSKINQEYSSSITRELSVTTSLDVLEQIAAGNGPEDFLMALGCANWNPGQLEQEIKQNEWLLLPADSEIIFNVSAKEKYNKCLELLGIKPWQLSMFSGNS